MVQIKSYTDLEQSRKLAEFLPLESADMCWTNHCYGTIRSSLTVSSKTIEEYKNLLTRYYDLNDTDVFYPCWSLSALLNVLPKKYYPIRDHETNLILGKPNDKWCVLYWDATGMQDGEQTLADNLVDACVAMIEKLHELKML